MPSASRGSPRRAARVAVDLLRRIDEETRPDTGRTGPSRPGSARPQDRVVAHGLVLRESTEGAAGRDGVW